MRRGEGRHSRSLIAPNSQSLRDAAGTVAGKTPPCGTARRHPDATKSITGARSAAIDFFQCRDPQLPAVIGAALSVNFARMTGLNSIRRWCPMIILPAVICWHAAFGGIAPAREDIVFLVDNSRDMQRIDEDVGDSRL